MIFFGYTFENKGLEMTFQLPNSLMAVVRQMKS